MNGQRKNRGRKSTGKSGSENIFTLSSQMQFEL